MNTKGKVLNKLKTGVKKVGRFLDRQFIEPTRRVNSYNKAMDTLNKDNARQGKFNTGEESARSQTY
jgi:hypothetical protein